jgi:hypothetical protein
MADRTHRSASSMTQIWRLPGEGRDPWQKWAPAFAGVTNQGAVG